MKWRLWLATLGLAGCAEAGSLTLCYEDVDIYPLSYGKSEGLNYFMLQTMARHLDLKITYKQLPWKRCQFEVRQGISDGIFSAAFNAERSEYADYPLRPDGTPDGHYRMNKDYYSAYRRTGSVANWRGGKFMHTRTIGIHAGYSVAPELRAAGFMLEERSKTSEDLFRKLDNRIVDLVITPQGEAEYTLQKNTGLAAHIERLPEPYKEIDMFLALNKSFCKQHNGLCPKIWQELKVIRESADYQQLLRKYGVKE